MEGNKPSEADILAQNAKLTTDLATAQASIVTANTQISALTSENTTLKADKATLTTQLATANASLSTVTAERDSLKAEKTTVDAAAAKAVAKLGIDSPAGKSDVKAPADNKKLSFTDRILAAKGCKTLEELEAKRQPMI
jgi:chromosome segregation ATPase